MEYQTKGKYLAVIVSEVKSSSRELYPLTKNYPMALTPIGTKKLIVYQLQSLVSLPSIQKVTVIVDQEDNSLRSFVETQFLGQHKEYPHKIDFFSTKEVSNTFVALKQLLSQSKDQFEGILIIHGDTVLGVPLSDLFRFHEEKKSDLSLLLKAKRELGEQQKKLPQGEVQTELDNILLGEKGQLLFIDMMDELQNNGVRINPSIYGQVRKAAFKRVLDSKVYLMSSKIGRILLELPTDQIYDIKTELIPFLVKNQTNKKLLKITNQMTEEDLKPLLIFASFKEQETFIRKISTKKIYQSLNFDSLHRGSKQKRDILLPTSYSESMQLKSANSSLMADNVSVGNGAVIRRSLIGANCKIGKNVELFNCILLQGVEVKDNCRIKESVLGQGTVVGQNSQIKGAYSESKCRVADSSKIDGQTIIRTQ